jgi:hypothetical protein
VAGALAIYHQPSDLVPLASRFAIEARIAFGKRCDAHGASIATSRRLLSRRQWDTTKRVHPGTADPAGHFGIVAGMSRPGSIAGRHLQR